MSTDHLKKPQYIHLDFDRESTFGNGELVTVEHVSVDDSGLNPEHIAGLMTTFMAVFSDRHVDFLTERPDSDGSLTVDGGAYRIAGASAGEPLSPMLSATITQNEGVR